MAISGKLLRGTRFGLRFGSTAHDLGITSFTIVAQGPADENGVFPDDLVWRWRPSDLPETDPEFSYDSGSSKLTWQLTSTWTYDGFAVGAWKLYLLVGEPPTNQDNMTEYNLAVKDGKAGRPMPISDS